MTRTIQTTTDKESQTSSYEICTQLLLVWFFVESSRPLTIHGYFFPEMSKSGRIGFGRLAEGSSRLNRGEIG